VEKPTITLGQPRSSRRALIEIVGGGSLVLLLLVIAASVVPAGDAAPKGIQPWLFEYGAALSLHSAWFLPSLLAVILGVYASVWIRSTHSIEAHVVQQQRVEHAVAAELTAGVAIVWSVLCVFGLASRPNPSEPGAATASIVITLILVTLAARVGRFATLPVETQIRVIKLDRRQAKKELRVLPSPPPWGLRRAPAIITGTLLAVIGAPTVTMALLFAQFEGAGQAIRLVTEWNLILLIAAAVASAAGGWIRLRGPKWTAVVLWPLYSLGPGLFVLTAIVVGDPSLPDQPVGLIISASYLLAAALLLWSTWPWLRQRATPSSWRRIDVAIGAIQVNQRERQIARATHRIRLLRGELPFTQTK
jgi:hypothetical protein